MLRGARDNSLANHPTTCSPYRLLFLSIVSSATRVNATFRSFLPLVSPRYSQVPESDQAGQNARPGTHCISSRFSLSGIRLTRGLLCLSPWSPPLFLSVDGEHCQAKCILPGDVFPPAARSRPAESKRTLKSWVESLQGQGHRGMRPDFQITFLPGSRK